MVKYSERMEAKRVPLSITVAPHVANLLRLVASRTGSSLSSVANEYLEQAINLPSASQRRKASGE